MFPSFQRERETCIILSLYVDINIDINVEIGIEYAFLILQFFTCIYLDCFFIFIYFLCLTIVHFSTIMMNFNLTKSLSLGM